jgi:hypothetical protein
MSVRHIIVCEGESEWAYLQRLQSFLEAQPLPNGSFDPPLILIGPKQAVVKSGTFGKLKSRFNKTRNQNKNSSIQIWADFDLYHRNNKHCADHYKNKPQGIPNFLFSFHNFEDFLALHSDGARFQDWRRFGSQGHFAMPLHSEDYLPEIQRIFPGHKKGDLSVDFITWDTLKNLKRNLDHQPTSNPNNLQELRGFANFLITEIENAYPYSLD